MNILSVDFGTSAVKMSILNEKLETISWNKGSYEYQILPGEKNELREADLWQAFYEAAAGLDQDALKKTELLCYDTFSPSPVFMDRAGDLVYPAIITHLDRRSRAQTDYIDRCFGRDRYMDIAGIYPFPGGCSAMTLIWFKQNVPEVLERCFAFGHLTTYVHKRLTGEWMVDFVNASMTGMYETTRQGGWSQELIREFGLREEMFGEICLPGRMHGRLQKNIAERLGVPEGIPVAVGTNDMAAAQAGAGNNRAGCIMITAGSSEMISILTDQARVNPRYYLRNAALPGLWQIYATTCGGFGLTWFWEQFCRELSAEQFFQAEAQAINQYLLHGTPEVTFDPYLTGDRQSLQKKTGAWHGLTLAATREDMLIAYLIGIQEVLGETLQRAQECIPLSKVIKISGGMVTPEYLKLKEQYFEGYTFESVEDCPIRGNAVLALQELGSAG